MTFLTSTTGVVSTANSASSISSSTYLSDTNSVVSATSTTVVLGGSSSTVDDYYNEKVIFICQGRGNNQVRLVSDYDGSSKTVTVSQSWDIVPDTTSVYVVYGQSGRCGQHTYTVVDSPLIEVVLSAYNPQALLDNYCAGCYIKLLAGPGQGQLRRIVKYTGSNQLAVVDRAWTERPTSDTCYAIFGESGTAVTSGSTVSNIVLSQHTKFVTTGILCEIVAGTNLGQVRTLTVPALNRQTTSITVNNTSVDQDYLTLYDANGSVAFWFDVDNSGSAEPAHGATSSVKVSTVLTGDSTSDIATKLAAALNQNSSFEASSSGSVVTTILLLTGSKTASTSSDASFTVSSPVSGTSTVCTLNNDWSVPCDNTSVYVLYAGYCGTFEDIKNYTQITSVTGVNTAMGQAVVVDMQLGLDGNGAAKRGKYAEISFNFPVSVHTLAVISQYFRLRLVSFGLSVTGTTQTIYHTQKNKALTSFVDETVTSANDCELTRAVMVARTEGDRYTNIGSDVKGNLNVSVSSPLGAFGSLLTVQPTPVWQASMVYNISPLKWQTFTNPAFYARLIALGDGSTAQQQHMYLPAQTALTASDYFFIYSPTPTTYYVWFNVSGADPDPSPGGTGLECDVSGDTTAAEVASTVASVINGQADFSAIAALGNLVIVTNTSTGAATGISVGSMPVVSTSSTSTNLGLATLTNEASIGGYMVIRSRRALIYRPGQGAEARFTALFQTPTTGVLQYAGLGNLTSALYFGTQASLGQFGVFRRFGGVPEIRVLTITSEASSGGTAWVELDGVRVSVTLDTVSPESNAANIAKVDYSHLRFRANQINNTVVFMSTSVTPTEGPRNTGNYSLTMNTAVGAVGSFARTRAGEFMSEEFVPQYEWNVDTMDGSGPSQKVLDVTKGNVYSIAFQWLGFGGITMSIENADSNRIVPVHQFKYANSAVTPSLNTPSMQLAYVTSATTTATEASISMSSGAFFIHGPVIRESPIFSTVSATITPANQDTDYIALVLRIGAVYQNVNSLIEAQILSLDAVNTGSRTGAVKVFLNPTITETENYVSVNEESGVLVWAPTANNLTGFSGGTLLTSIGILRDNSQHTDLKNQNIIFDKEDYLLFTVRRFASTATITITPTWVEDH